MQLHVLYPVGVSAAQPTPQLDSFERNVAECTALKLRRTARKVTQIYDEALSSHGLTIGQFGILAGLRRSRGVSIAALAEQLSTDASTLSRLLKPLAAAGLLTSETDPDDRRAKLLRLTEAGAVRIRAAGAAWTTAQKRVRELLGEPCVAALHYILDDSFSKL
jgi:DNA-binding MarR family transcriptional regulator